MSGLLEKDICLLLRGHRNMLILFFMICVFLGLGQPGTFILGYLPSISDARCTDRNVFLR